MRSVVDLHCDVLSKMARDSSILMNGPADGKLDVTLDRLTEGGVALQVFAMWVPDTLPRTPETLFREAELFVSKILTCPGIRFIQQASDVEAVFSPDAGAIGALLSLEGVDALRGQWWALRLLQRLGLRLLGPTWNDANWACDGAGEPRGGGLTREGRQLIAECEALKILVDVSHLSERGFWDTLEMAKRPCFASHSNARALCSHPRNLGNDQIQALIAVNGLIGLTFVPFFLTQQSPARLTDLLRQVEYICERGGARHIAFGSDFDGVDVHVEGLSHPGEYPALADLLSKHYPESHVQDWLSGNAKRFLMRNLPN